MLEGNLFFSFVDFVDLLIQMLLEMGRTFKWDNQGTDIVDVDVHVNVYELQRKAESFQKKLGEGCLTQSSTTGLITTQDQPVNLV